MKKNKKKRESLLPELPIPNGAITWLIVSMGIAIGWHIPHTPIWATITAYLVGIYTYFRIIKSQPMPPKWLRIAITIAMVGGIMVTFRSFLGRDPGITTLVLLSSMKLMELKNRKDFMFIVFLCYFMVFGNFLYDQSIEDLAFTLIAAILITATLLRLNQQPDEKPRVSKTMRFSLKLTIYALPFTVLLFFMFPRSTGPLWNFSQESVDRFQSGFNDSIEPGQIANLAQSKLPAFKVEFPEGNQPEMKDLYFRGLVLWFTNGKKWVQGILPSRYVRPRSYDGEGVLQRITLEPHNQRWLFGLDWPTIYPGWSRVLPGNVFGSRHAIKSYYRYQVRSRLTPEIETELSDTHRRWALQLPEGANKRIVALGKSWARENQDPIEILRVAERYFKENEFLYTLNPGIMDTEEPLEEFLFEERRGFCEHYAAAFSLLMRAAGVPTRMVLGFQGGEQNSVGDYLLVRHSDAHAWAEIFLEGRGWERVDPTAWVAPERIEYGLDVSQNLSNFRNLSDAERSSAIQGALKKGFFDNILKFFKEHWDNINYKWDVWIISYDRFKQQDFLKNIGLEEIGRGGLFLSLIIIVPLFFMSVSYLLKRQTLSKDPVLQVYQKFCLKMAKAGIARMQWEGPVHFKKRIIEKFPDKAEGIDRFNDLFIRLRYGAVEVSNSHIKELKRAMNNV